MKKRRIKNAAILAAALTGMYMINTALFKKAKPVGDIIEGEHDYYFSPFGKIYYVKKGEGEPLLLIHGIGSGASSFMWRKNFDEFAKHYTVYCFDFPGFGKSEKMPVTYTADMYINVIKHFINSVIGRPAYVIANSQAAAYAISLEYNNPNMIKKIISVCPTGIFELSTPPSTVGKAINFLFKIPITGTFMYNMLVCRPHLIYFLRKKTYYNKDLASKFVINHYEDSARQDGYLSKYAPASFLGGYLNKNIINSVKNFSKPMLIIWGNNSSINTIDNLRNFTDLNPDFKTYVFEECGYLPQEEYAVEFNKLCLNFFKE